MADIQLQKVRDAAALFTAQLCASPGTWFKAPAGVPEFSYGLAPPGGRPDIIYLHPAAFDCYAEETLTGKLEFWFRRKVRPDDLPDG